jgi:hypothetical protein
MPKDLSEWSIVISVTALLLVIPLNVVSNILTPMLKNWWATRSEASLRKRIQKLEARSSKMETLPLLSEFEAMLLIGIEVFIQFMMSISGMVLTLYALLRGLQHNPLDSLTSRFILIFLFAIMAIGTRWQNFFSKFRLERSLKYREKLRKNIEGLRRKMERRTDGKAL